MRASLHYRTQLFGLALLLASILSVLRLHVSLSTEDSSTTWNKDHEVPVDSPQALSNATTSMSLQPRRSSHQKKKKTSGKRIDANTPTVIPVHPPPVGVRLPLQVSFRGVAGLGHRLFRQSNAYHLAKGLYLDSIDIDWGWCHYNVEDADDGDKKNSSSGHADIASHMFGGKAGGATTIPIPHQEPSSQRQLPMVSFPFIQAIQWKNDELIKRQQETSARNSKTTTLDFVNEVTHYNERQYSIAKMMRQTPKFYGKDRSDLEIYQTLVQRFQQRHPRVQYWKQKLQFDNHTVIGLHVRQGNGEKGDFRSKGRGIQGLSEDEWISNLARLLLNFTATTTDTTNNHNAYSKPPMIFLASDSSNATHFVEQLQQDLNRAAHSLSASMTIPHVVTVQQPRIPDGKGVSYQYIFDSKESCLEGWVAQMTDMILLAESDVVVAGQYSSFTQCIPLSYQFAKATARRAKEVNNTTKNAFPSTGLFCNVGRQATLMECFDDFGEWMMGRSSLPLIGDTNGEKQDCKNLITMPVNTMMLSGMLQRKLKALPVNIVKLV